MINDSSSAANGRAIERPRQHTFEDKVAATRF
jgi:hypothetical protein